MTPIQIRGSQSEFSSSVFFFGVGAILMSACATVKDAGRLDSEQDDKNGSLSVDKGEDEQASDDDDALAGGTKSLDKDELEEIIGDSCAEGKFKGEPLPSVIQLVVDVSSSMNERAPGSRQSKWEVTRDFLIEGIVGEEGHGLPASVSAGLLFYPNRSEVEATVESREVAACVNTEAFVAPALLGGRRNEHRDLLRTSIEEVVTERWTPTHDAFHFALHEGLLDREHEGQKIMILITDGSPTMELECSQPEGQVDGVDPEPLVEEIAFAASQGVRTFLIGSPGSEDNRQWMSRAAVVGESAPEGCNINGPVGEYCHMDMTTAEDFAKALREALAQIAGVASTCSYEIPELPSGKVFQEEDVNLLLKQKDGGYTLVYRNDKEGCKEGWSFDEAGRVELCENTCSGVQFDDRITVEVVLGCESRTVIK